MKRWLRIAAIAAALIIVAIQLYPARRENPAVAHGLVAPPEVEAILRRSCFDCHSNETRWRWYAYVAPVSWLVASDVEDGRRHLNFSNWGELSEKKRRTKAESIVDEVKSGDMPLAIYLRMHGDARLSASDIDVLERWASEQP
jgi:hypothetical protein